MNGFILINWVEALRFPSMKVLLRVLQLPPMPSQEQLWAILVEGKMMCELLERLIARWALELLQKVGIAGSWGWIRGGHRIRRRTAKARETCWDIDVWKLFQATRLTILLRGDSWLGGSISSWITECWSFHSRSYCCGWSWKNSLDYYCFSNWEMLAMAAGIDEGAE